MSVRGQQHPKRRVAYIVSRFPETTQTFILREFSAIDDDPDYEVELFALFPGEDTAVHPEARPWLARRHRASPHMAALASMRWLYRRPGAAAAVWLDILRDYGCRPRQLARALVATGLGCAHAETMQAAEVDHIHAHFATYPALAAWVAHRLTGIDYSVTPHAHDIFVHQTGLKRRFAEATHVVAISRYNWMYLQHFGAKANRLRMIRYGLDLEVYRYTPRVIPQGGAVDVLCVSSFRTYKGHRFLIEALAVGPGLERLRVELIGVGPLMDEMKTLAGRLGVANQCEFVGAKDQAYVRGRLASAHLLVQPSIVQDDGDTEGLPNTVIEAAASGCLVVATRVAGIPELIEDRVSGILTEPCSAEDLAEGLARALASEGSEAMTAEARGRVEEQHDLARTTERLKTVFAAPAGVPAGAGT